MHLPNVTVKKYCPKKTGRYATGLTGSSSRPWDFAPNFLNRGVRMAETGGSLNGSLSEEILSLVESDTRFWNDAAQRCEHVAGTVGDEREKREWELMAAVYRERVNIHAVFVAKLRERLDGSVSSSSKSVRSILTTRT
jgi:hypothetical protein